MGFWNEFFDALPWNSSDSNKVDAKMTSTAYMGVTVDNIQSCATPDNGWGGGSINLDLHSAGDMTISSIDLSQTSTDIVQCFYSATTQDAMTQALTDTLTAMAENNTGLMSAILAASGKNVVDTTVVQGATQQVTVNNMQQCGVGSSNINIDLTSGGSMTLGNITASNNPYSFLGCVFSSNNVNNLSQQLAALINDSTGNTKVDPFAGLMNTVVFVAIFIGLIIGGFLAFRVADAMFPPRRLVVA